MQRNMIVLPLLLLALISFAGGETGVVEGLQPPVPVGGMEALKANVIPPSSMLELAWSSELMLSIRIDARGNVKDITVVRSGGAAYDRAAIEAIQRTRWSPARQNGQPICVRYLLPFKFCCK